MSSELDIDVLLSDLVADSVEEVGLDDLEAVGCGDERAESHARVRGTERMVPAVVRGVLPSNFLLRQQVLERIISNAKARAVAAERSTHETGIRRIISEGWGDSAYRRWVRGLVETTLERGHLDRREANRLVPRIIPKLPPSTGPWKAKGNLDLGLDAVLEAPADEVAVGLASMIVGVPGGLLKTRALVLGAGSSAVGMCVDGIERELGRAQSRVEVIEVDAFEWQRGSRCIRGPRLRWDQDLLLHNGSEEASLRMDFTRPFRPTFHIVVFTPPCPAIGSAAQVRNRYIMDGSEQSRTVCDPGRYGLKRWILTVAKAMARAVEQLRPDGTMVGLIPLGIRTTFQDATGEYEPGLTYVDSGEPWDALAPVIETMGLRIERTVEVVERNPKKAPFVADRRPRYRFFEARKETS